MTEIINQIITKEDVESCKISIHARDEKIICTCGKIILTHKSEEHIFERVGKKY